MNYEQANSKLTGRNAQSRKISYSCRLERRENGAIAVKMHATDIITFFPDGRSVVNIGNWFTVTTKARLNDFLPFGRVYSDRGTWYVQVNRAGENWENGTRYLFANGMTFNPDGTITGAADDSAKMKNDAMRRRIKKYADAFTSKLASGEIEAPGAGDCMYCAMREVETGVPWGEMSAESARDHVMSHLDEDYYVPSLAFRAVEMFANSVAVRSWIAGATGLIPREQSFFGTSMDLESYVRRAIRKYVTRQLGMAA